MPTLQADLFYTVQNTQAIPLNLVTGTQWEPVLETATAAERNYFSSRQFKGARGDSCFIYNADGLIDKVYIGSGLEQQELALAQAALLVPPGCYYLQESVSQQTALAWALAQYRFFDYKDYKLVPRILVVQEAELSGLRSLADAVFLVRDLINKPANDMNPQHLAEVVAQLAKTYEAHYEEWVGQELLQANFPAIHAVGRAADTAPRLVSLTWGKDTDPKVTLVGKGVCFDSGGLDIKPAAGMRFMKKDMAGAAYVIGLAQWIMQNKLPVRLQVFIPAVENAIGPNAFRPGDVLRMRNGLTVEIDNTDAEGRLILADALVKACEEKPDVLIDFATLTGAARTAVGTELPAFFCNNELLAAQLTASANHVSDPVWRLPLFAGYDDLLSSSIADLANSSATPYAGAIIAGLFLQRFISKTTPWLHFDMMGWNVTNKPGKPEGGEAMGLRAVAAYLLQVYG